MTLEGNPVTGLTDATISLTLIKSGITQSIAGLYTISPQQRGIYRIVFNSSIMTDSDVDYVLIAQDTTGLALDDKVEFTLYDETIDSVYSKLKTEIDVNENLLNVINAGTDEVESLLKNATYGLSAAKILQDNHYSNLSNSVTTVQNEVISQANENEVKIDTIIASQGTDASDILTQIGVANNKLDIVESYTDEVESLLKNATYGLSKLGDKLDIAQGSQTTNTSFIINEVISQANENEVKIDTLTNSIALIIPEINANENKLDSITSYIDEVESLIKNTTYGLSSLKNKLNDLESQHSANTSTIVNEVISQANQNEVKIDTIIASQGTDASDILTQIGVANNKLDIVESYTDEVESLIKNTTYGLSSLKNKLNDLESQHSANTSTIVNEVISQANQNEVKIDTLTNNVALIIPEINANENKLDIITSHVDEVEPILKNATYGLSVLKTTLVDLQTQNNNNTTNITAEVISQANQNEVKIDTLTSNLSTIEGNLTTQISSIPTNPLLTNDSRVSKLNYLDTSSSQIATLSAQQTWAYPARYLTGTSGVNQIDVSGLSTGFLTNQNASVNITLIHKYTGDLITGRTYPTNIGIELWKGGILVDTSANITCVETALSIYRITINAVLINTPAIDYILVISDLLNEATSQIVEFTAFEITGVASPRTVTLHITDSATLLPLPDVQVYVKDTSNIMIINKGLTDDSGNYNTGLKEGTYKIILRKTHVDFTVPEILTVSGDTVASYQGVAFSPSLPITPNTCVLYGYILDISSNYLKGAKVTATETNSNTYSGEFKVLKLVKSTVSDVNGYWELELLWSSLLTPVGIPYKIDITYPGYAYSVTIIIPNTASVELSTLI